MGLQMALLSKPHLVHPALQAAPEAAVLSSSAVLDLCTNSMRSNGIHKFYRFMFFRLRFASTHRLLGVVVQSGRELCPKVIRQF